MPAMPAMPASLPAMPAMPASAASVSDEQQQLASQLVSGSMLGAMQPRGGDASASVTHLATIAGTGIAPSCYTASPRATRRNCEPFTRVKGDR